MLGKLFNKKSVPLNGGKTASSGVDKLYYVKVFELELSNMENAPVYELKHQLSIGSEIGNIVIADPSLSPRHATFILQDDVVSIIDHGSVAGTLINGKKVTAGKYIILEETDLVQLGDLELRLRVGSKTAPPEFIPEIPGSEIRKHAPKIEAEDVLEINESISNTPEKAPTDTKPKLKLVSNKKVTKPTSKHSANSIVRVFAVLCDILLSYSLLIIFMPFDAFRELLGFIPSVFTSLIDVTPQQMLELILEDYEFATKMLQDAFNFFSSTFHIGPLLIVFFLLRLSTTLVLGTSVSEFALGVRATGNGLWARIGGVLRVLIGIITGPFLIFDTPSIVSRRTFKEFITFTNIAVPSTFVSILGFVFFLPLMLLLSVVSPLMQGLESPQAILVNDQIEQRVKVKLPSATEVTEVKDRSSTLNAEITYDPKDLALIPNFKFQSVNQKLNLKNSIIFYQRDIQRQVEMEVLKTFDMRQLLGIGMKGNVFLYDKYPEIYNFVYASTEGHPSFKKTLDAKDHAAFANEFIKFTKVAFSLNSNNALEIMQDETLLLKGFVDYKSSFLALIEYKDFDEIGFIKMGNSFFMKIVYNKQKPFDLIIPLIEGEGKIFKISYDKKENAETVSSKFYKFNLDRTDWIPVIEKESPQVMTALGVFDLFSSDNFKSTIFTNEIAQAVYGYYFETSGSVLAKGDPVELEIWKSRAKNFLNLIEAIPFQAAPGEDDPKTKLLQNFRDMLDALDNGNSDYFGVSQSKTV